MQYCFSGRPFDRKPIDFSNKSIQYIRDYHIDKLYDYRAHLSLTYNENFSQFDNFIKRFRQLDLYKFGAYYYLCLSSSDVLFNTFFNLHPDDNTSNDFSNNITESLDSPDFLDQCDNILDNTFNSNVIEKDDHYINKYDFLFIFNDFIQFCRDPTH